MPAKDENGLWASLKELYRAISPGRRRQFSFVLVLMALGAFAELATIGAVLPFLSLLADQSNFSRIALPAAFFGALGATTPREQLVAATVLFIIIAFVAGVIRLQLAWSSQGFVFRLGHDIAVDIQRRILLQPYRFHINHNSSELIASFENVEKLVFNVLLTLMQAATAFFISLFIIGALIFVDPFTATVAAAAFAAIYVGVSTFTRRRLASNSAIVGSAYGERVKIVQESLGGIRDVIIDNSQAIYLEAFRSVDQRLTTARTNTAFIGAAPRFIIEAIGMILIAGIALTLSQREGGVAGALPILGALALGAQRLLPLLQQIYNGWTVASGHRSLLTQVLGLLSLPVPQESLDADDVRPLPLRDRIRVENISFAYAARPAAALDEVSLDIPRGSRLAFIGRTGSGKSTFADLLMGLLEPTSGRILVDGEPLTIENRRRWQRSIAHVPQAIFLADTSIARNIAFGVAAEDVDMARVIDAATKAQLHDFITSLGEQYETHVGERGIRLSGGQRQRLGIARAIYKEAPVLVLDEATSALDDATEAAVMRALDLLGEEGRTIIIIAHRLSTISGADIVARLDGGRLVELGSYGTVVGGSHGSQRNSKPRRH